MNVLKKYTNKMMGSIVGTVHYDRVSHDNFGHIICDIREIHRLSTPSPQKFDIIWGKRFDGAEVNGYWVAIYGKDKCKRMILSFLRECQFRLEKSGATGIEISMKEM